MSLKLFTSKLSEKVYKNIYIVNEFIVTSHDIFSKTLYYVVPCIAAAIIVLCKFPIQFVE